MIWELFVHLLRKVRDMKPEAKDDLEDSNLMAHARRELALIHEEETVVKGYLDMIAIFVKMGHSGGSASVFIPTLSALLQFKNLSPLTNDPDEWMYVGSNTGESQGIWQSKRNPEAFSPDGGQHYYFLSEGAHSHNQIPLHESEEKM